jgi:hypothetical protein
MLRVRVVEIKGVDRSKVQQVLPEKSPSEKERIIGGNCGTLKLKSRSQETKNPPCVVNIRGVVRKVRQLTD